MFGLPKPLKPGDELTTEWLNGIRAAIKQATINLGVNSGLSMIQTEAGTFLRAGNGQVFGQLAVTDGTVPAATVTGTGTSTQMTEGVGNVFLLVWNDTAGAWIVDPMDADPYEVINFSTTTGGIATDTLVWIQRTASDDWFITAVDCAN